MNVRTLYFTDSLHMIKEEVLKKFTKFVLERAPDYFYEIPASASGKYHPAYSLKNGGLCAHTKALCYIARDLHNSNMFELTDHEYNLALVALHLHDILKNGNPNKQHTIFQHPILASRFTEQLWGEFGYDKIPEYDILQICEAIESHMGKWNKSKDGTEVLKNPISNLQKFVHTCDYVGSRRYLDFDFSKV